MKDKLLKILSKHNPDTESYKALDSEEAADQILNTLIEEVEGLYQPGITDLEKDEHQGLDRPVIYLDQVINILKGDKHA